MFVDEVVLTVISGNGGPGSKSFRREKYVPKGGPDGGDGGRGGDVFIVASSHKNTLVDFRHVHEMKADNGASGGSAHCTGRSAEPLMISVPPGTLIFDDATGALLADLDHLEASYLAAPGGDGGKGNARFRSSVNRAPRFAGVGYPGKTIRLRLELKLLADVGIIGLPSVGKSSFIARVSAARPEIAAYHFTTLIPNLGVVEHFPNFPFVVADMPGLIQGAHEGKGLGIQFLKHIQRTQVLLHLIDVTSETPMEDWEGIRHEMEQFDPELLKRPEVIGLNKIDLLPDGAEDELVQELIEAFKKMKRRALPVSTATGVGVDALLRKVAVVLKRRRETLQIDS